MDRLRMVTFNIAHGRGLQPIQGLTSARKIRSNLRRIAELLLTLKPDVVALQEIDQASSWAGNFDHLEYLREAMEMPHSVFGINNRHTGFLNLNYGNALLSRHPILNWENIAFGQKCIGEKGFLFAEIDVRNSCVPIINMHLDYRSRIKRFDQVERVMEYVSTKYDDRQHHWSLPPIVCGDLNNPSDTQDATALLCRYFSRHGHYSLHPYDEGTFPSPLPCRTLDFVFLPPQCMDVHCKVIPVMLSDHCPVLVEFRLQKSLRAKAA